MVSRVWQLNRAAWAIALALVCAGGLLIGLDRGIPALSASDRPGSDASTLAWAEGDDVMPTWTSTEPVTTVVGRNPFVWPITQHGVTITFYSEAVGATALFTFTPKSEVELPMGYLSTPYVFDLNGTYQANGKPVSLGNAGIQIEVTYDPSRLDEIEEDSLQFFHRGKTDWLPQGGDVDLVDKMVSLRTERTQSFAIGGEPPKTYLYLSLVMRK